jgi:hypothetical protein
MGGFPISAMSLGEPTALKVKVIVPVKTPRGLTGGENTTLIVQTAFAARLPPQFVPRLVVTVNCAVLEFVITMLVSVAVPLFVKVKVLATLLVPGV